MKFKEKSLVALIVLMLTGGLCGCGGNEDAVTCKDGWVSHSKDKQGACSSHGGVA